MRAAVMGEGMNVLVVEDQPTDAELWQREVKRVLPESRFFRVETREDLLMALETFQPALIISDYLLFQFDDLTALKLAMVHAPETPFIIPRATGRGPRIWPTVLPKR